jgi:AcrR family transcriptional regulator
MVECVGACGYAATTVPDVVAAARVSRNGFYALFEDKADCFLALCDELATEILAELTAFGGQAGWRTALDRGMARYLDWWQTRPAIARAYLVEVPSAGPRAIAQRDRQFERFAAMFDGLAAQARREDPDLPAPNALATRLLVAGITEVVAAEVRHGRLETLGSLHDPLVELAATVLTAPA